MDDLISVIVPIYNVGDYLRKCIDSIINQTYTNLEIILVDDGSTDNCGSICDEYKLKDNRIKVIHKPNGGLSSARNAGLDIATGSLIGFVDSDDYIEPTMYEELYNNMIKYGSDIAICNIYNDIYGKKNIRIKNESYKEFFSKDKEKFNNIHSKCRCLMVVAWNKLYKRYIFDNIRYPNGRIYEDSFILCELLDRANKVSFIFNPLYNYIYRKDSIVNAFSIDHFDRIGSFNKMINFLNNKGYYDLAIKEKNEKITILIINLSKMLLYKINNPDIFNKYKKELKETSKEISWKDSNRRTKIYKIIGNSYIYIRYIEYKIWYFIKRRPIIKN